jgi:hypothetical protein
MARDIVDLVTEALRKNGIKPTKASVTYYYLKSLKESYRSVRVGHGRRVLAEGADMDPEQVQAALEDAAGQLATLQDFLNPDNFKRFEAAAEFIPQLEEFFGSLNTHFEIQKQKEEEAMAAAEEEAANAESEAEAEAEENADAAEEEAADEQEAAEDESAAAEDEGQPQPEEAPPAEKAQAEEPADEGGEEELAESLLRRWKTLADIRG